MSIVGVLDRPIDMTTAIANDTPASANTSRMARIAPIVARVLLGLAFVVFGLNGFLNFLPMPKEAPPEGAMAFGMAMMKTGYMMKFVKGTEVLVGLMLLTKRAVPLALIILAPVMLNILAFHAFLAPSGLPVPFFLLALHLYLAWTYRATYAPLFRS